MRLIAFYLPQFHPIPENDEWWGKGFTEWTNVARARPLFRGHYQPRIPGELGFYDLRLAETRWAQAALAQEHGIEGFCYYHYWFAGKRLLERPFQEVLRSGEPDFPFCLCWANESWSGIWHGAPDRVLIEQTYPGVRDHREHFYSLLPAFTDPRYLTVEGKPLFLVYSPTRLPEATRTTDLWRELANASGFKGLYLVGVERPSWSPQENGFDASTPSRFKFTDLLGGRFRQKIHYLRSKVLKGRLRVALYRNASVRLVPPEGSKDTVFPCAVPNWDNTPRSGRAGLVLHGSTPELFRRHLRLILRQVADKPAERRITFVKSWNEWAEGNYLEPDLRFGRAYLQVVREEVELRLRGALSVGVSGGA